MALPALALAVVPKLLDMGLNWIDKAVPDKDLAEKLKHDMRMNLLPLMQQELQTREAIIVAEANSESWIARSWRPITMLTFVALIVAHWFGFTVPGLSESERLATMELVKIGLGGYVVGRSAEKVAKHWRGNENQR